MNKKTFREATVQKMGKIIFNQYMFYIPVSFCFVYEVGRATVLADFLTNYEMFIQI